MLNQGVQARYVVAMVEVDGQEREMTSRYLASYNCYEPCGFLGTALDNRSIPILASNPTLSDSPFELEIFFKS